MYGGIAQNFEKKIKISVAIGSLKWDKFVIDRESRAHQRKIS